MTFRLVHELAADRLAVAVPCRLLGVSASGFYEWQARGPSTRDVEDAHLLDTIISVPAAARGTFGVRRVHAELRLGQHVQVRRKRVERLMACHGLAGVHRRRFRRGRPSPAVHVDSVGRRFSADAPARLWVADFVRHEAPWIRVEVRDLHRRAVAAVR